MSDRTSSSSFSAPPTTNGSYSSSGVPNPLLNTYLSAMEQQQQQQQQVQPQQAQPQQQQEVAHTPAVSASGEGDGDPSHNKRAALTGQWRTPPLPVFPTAATAGAPSGQHLQPAPAAAPAPIAAASGASVADAAPTPAAAVSAIVGSLPPLQDFDLPDTTEDYAKALQEAYRRGAEAAAAMAARQAQQVLAPSASCPDFGVAPVAAAATAPAPSAPVPAPVPSSSSSSSTTTAPTPTYAAAPQPPPSQDPQHSSWPPQPAPQVAVPSVATAAAPSSVMTNSTSLPVLHQYHHHQQQQQQQQSQQYQYQPVGSASAESSAGFQQQQQQQQFHHPLMPPPPPPSAFVEASAAAATAGTAVPPQPAAAPAPQQPSGGSIFLRNSLSMPNMPAARSATALAPAPLAHPYHAGMVEEEKRLKRLARNRASARLRRLRKKNLVDAYETEVGILERTLQALKQHEWGSSLVATAPMDPQPPVADASAATAQEPSSLASSLRALTEALSMDRGQQALTKAERQAAAQDILRQQLEFVGLLEQLLQEQHVLHQLGRAFSSPSPPGSSSDNNANAMDHDGAASSSNSSSHDALWRELQQELQLTPEQLHQLAEAQAGWDEEWAALQTVKQSLEAMVASNWLWNEGCTAICDEFLSLLHKNQISKFLLWADANVESIDELDGVNAPSQVPQGPVFSFGVNNNPESLLEEEVM